MLTWLLHLIVKLPAKLPVEVNLVKVKDKKRLEDIFKKVISLVSWKKSDLPYFEPILIREYFRETILDLWQMSQQLWGAVFALPKVKVTALFFWKHYFQRWKEKLDPNCSHTLVTVVIPLLPAYDRYLPTCVGYWYHACHPFVVLLHVTSSPRGYLRSGSLVSCSLCSLLL